MYLIIGEVFVVIVFFFVFEVILGYKFLVMDIVWDIDILVIVSLGV